MPDPVAKGHYCPHCGNAVDAEDSICLACNLARRGAWPLDPYVGRTIGRKYRITRRISASETGMVFAATQMHGDTELGAVIIKMLSKQLSGDQAMSGRFVHEAQAARTLTSPHMVRVFDLDFDAGHVPYLVMENVAGEPLDEIMLQEGRMDPGRALSIALQVAEGMEEAHGKSILHRNIRPSNIVVRQRDNDDFVKIIGLSLPRRSEGMPEKSLSSTDDPYVAPELRAGGTYSEKTDIWALGAVLHEMLTGETPTQSVSVRARVVDLPLAIVEIVDSMVETEPADRPTDMTRVSLLIEQAAHEAGYTTDITGRINLSLDSSSPGPRASKPPASHRSSPPAPPASGRPEALVAPPALPDTGDVASPLGDRAARQMSIAEILAVVLVVLVLVLGAVALTLWIVLDGRPAEPPTTPGPRKTVPVDTGIDDGEERDTEPAAPLPTPPAPVASGPEAEGSSVSPESSPAGAAPPAPPEKKKPPRKKPPEKVLHTQDQAGSPWTKLK